MSLESASMAPKATSSNQPPMHSMKPMSESSDTHAAQAPPGTTKYQPWRILDENESGEIALLIQRVDADFGRPKTAAARRK